jgi:hypothetical protein
MKPAAVKFIVVVFNAWLLSINRIKIILELILLQNNITVQLCIRNIKIIWSIYRFNNKYMNIWNLSKIVDGGKKKYYWLGNQCSIQDLQIGFSKSNGPVEHRMNRCAEFDLIKRILGPHSKNILTFSKGYQKINYSCTCRVCGRGEGCWQ